MSTHTPVSYSKHSFNVFVSCVSPSFLLQLHCNRSLDVFFCFQHHGELSLSEGEGGGLSGWAHSEVAKWKDGKGRGELSGRSHQVARV